MEKYIGTKILLAQPETLGEYNKRRGWTIPENENSDREGYFVEYSDGYVSWSPKEVFDEAYQRVPEDCHFTDEGLLSAVRSTVDNLTAKPGACDGRAIDPLYQAKYERVQCLQAAVHACEKLGGDPLKMARDFHQYVLNG